MSGARGAWIGLAPAMLIAAAIGCSGGGGGIIVSPSPAPTGSAIPTPAPCGTPIANGVFVAMASYITAAADPTYGIINGYALVGTDGTYSNVAQRIEIRPGDVVQFVNVEPAPAASQAPIQHSAVSLQGSTFPTPVPSGSPAPTFAPAAQSPLGTTISSSLWSTGRVTASATSTLCYSQSFSTPNQGTYAFGDYDYYASTNMRDVIVVSSSATRTHSRAPERSR